MAHKPHTRVLVVGGKAEFVGKFSECAKNPVGSFILDGTVRNRDNLVCVLLVDAKFHATAWAVEGGMDFVAVMEGIFHPDYFFDRGKFTEQFLCSSLFHGKLRLVGGVL